jgi:hypothetical protein
MRILSEKEQIEARINQLENVRKIVDYEAKEAMDEFYRAKDQWWVTADKKRTLRYIHKNKKEESGLLLQYQEMLQRMLTDKKNG